MDILPGFKLCRKGLHQYKTNLRQCPECRKQARKVYYEINKEKERATNKKWKEKNKTKVKKHDKDWYKNNKAKAQLDRKKWYVKNKNKVIARSNEWNKNHPVERRIRVAKRRALRKHAMPLWANHNEIKKIYVQCMYLTKTTGVKHEVDHIYPLQSKYMCGLHVETNLQILTAEENKTKGNRIWPGQLDCQRD